MTRLSVTTPTQRKRPPSTSFRRRGSNSRSACEGGALHQRSWVGAAKALHHKLPAGPIRSGGEKGPRDPSRLLCPQGRVPSARKQCRAAEEPRPQASSRTPLDHRTAKSGTSREAPGPAGLLEFCCGRCSRCCRGTSSHSSERSQGPSLTGCLRSAPKEPGVPETRWGHRSPSSRPC